MRGIISYQKVRENSPIQYELLPRNSERCRQQTVSDKTLIQQKWKICLNIFTIYSFQHKTFEILICLTRDARAGSRTLQLLLFNDRTNQEMFSIFFFDDSNVSLFSSEQRDLKTVATSNFHWIVKCVIWEQTIKTQNYHLLNNTQPSCLHWGSLEIDFSELIHHLESHE